MLMMDTVREFRETLKTKSRDELLSIIQIQNPEYIEEINLIEDVFRTKLQHLTWDNGQHIDGRPITNSELISLIDPPFIYDKRMARDFGMLEKDQRNLHMASDVVLWTRHFLNVQPRVYQCLVLRDQNLNRVMRLGRRMGKTYCMAMYLLWYSYTSVNGKSIVMTPMKSQSGVIYDTILEMAEKNELVSSAISRSVASPQYEIDFTNGSTIKLFTTGMKSGSKSDVVRGQEGHLIVLDEMDYMGKEDLVAVLPMLQATSAGQREKVLIAASTPSGQRNMFWDWNHSEDFSAFWFPTYCNPFWDEKTERRLRASTSEMAFRHEYEADWGEDAAGVYPKKYIDIAFDNEGWEYRPSFPTSKSFFLMGVDWDKYALDGGVNIVILEYCPPDHPDRQFAGKLRLAYREELLKDEYLLHKAVERIVQLNALFRPRHIYVDKGYGEMQVEYLHKWGLDHPETELHKVVKSWHFNETIEIPDPYTKMMTKQYLKPFMVENLRFLLEKQDIVFSSHDEDLYLQLISYIVTAVTETGRPKFGSGGAAPDHAHDALILAAFAFTHNYDKLLNPDYAVNAVSISNQAFLPMFVLETSQDEQIAKEKWEDKGSAPVYARRAMAGRSTRRGNGGGVRRRMF